MSKLFKKVYLEIGNICNLKCSFCPEVSQGKSQLNKTDYLKILQQVQPLAERVCLHVLGEPTNHPQFAEFVQLAGHSNINLEITTNGTMLTEPITQALLQTHVAQVNFSLQSFVDNFPNANLQTYLNKIFEYIESATQKNPQQYINLRLWNMPSTSGSDSLNEKILTLLETRFDISISRLIDVKLVKSKKLFGRVYLHYDSRFEWPSLDNKQQRHAGTCHGTRSHIGILADGSVIPCCLDKSAAINLGNLLQQPINDILETPRFLKMKHGFEQGKLVEELCQKCTFSHRFNSEASGTMK